MDLKTVVYEVQDGVATITMNRPEALNALNTDLHRDLERALQEAAGDAAVRAVVLTGAGRAFSAGGDIKAMAAKMAAADAGTAPPDPVASLREFHGLMAYLYDLPKPVVAAIHGPAVGAGMSVALACDLRIAAEDAVFSQAFIKIGLSPDGGSTWLLPRAVGTARAAYLAMTGDTLDARTALDWGIVQQVVAAGEDLHQARQLARRIAAFSPHALSSLKGLLRESERHTFAGQLDAEAVAQRANVTTAEFRAAIMAFAARK